MTEQYFLITNSEGETYVEPLTREQLKERLAESDFNHFVDPGNECNTKYWDGDALIIKGEVVMPERKEVVTEWDV